MSDPNPYAPPAAMPVPESQELFRREAEYLVVRNGAVLPPRCIKTNRPLGKRDWIRNRRIGYQPRWVQLVQVLPLGLMSLKEAFPGWILNTNYHLFMLVPLASLLCLLFLKRGRVSYGCTARVGVWRWGGFGISVGVSVLLGGFVFCGKISPYWLVFFAVITCLVAVLCVKKTSFQVARYQDGEFWLKGCGAAFLDSLSPP